jgi:hypothetical protein
MIGHDHDAVQVDLLPVVVEAMLEDHAAHGFRQDPSVKSAEGHVERLVRNLQMWKVAAVFALRGLGTPHT